MIIKEKIRQENYIKMKINTLYVGAFILAISEAIIAYVQSTFLNQFFNLNWVSLVFILTYIVAFLVINVYPNFIARFNNFRSVICALVIKLISLLIFIFCTDPALIFIGFVLFTVSFNLIFINFDIFLEAFSANAKTGRIRGTYFTIYNLGWLVSPFMAGQIIEKLNFNFLFSIDLILTVLVALVVFLGFRQFTFHFQLEHFSMVKTLREILHRKNIKKIFYCAFILNFFYAVMLIYLPIYLNQSIGLSWGEIGLIFTFMLVPFIILQYPAGYIADKYLGEKEILVVGLLIMALAAASMFFINTNSLLIWGIILLISRIGACLVEIMRESYFFKKVDAADIELINAFRSTTPLSYIIAPIIFGSLLYFLPLNYIFLVLGIIVLTGLYPAFTLKDTK